MEKNNNNRRIFIVSNRLPVTVKQKNGGFEMTPSVGGLATGLKTIFEQKNCIWIGWPGLTVHSEADKKSITAELDKLRMIPVFLNTQEIKKSYEGFCNVTIWPLFHYFTQYTDYDTRMWSVYKRVNQKFYKQLDSIITEKDIIWIHDYHLMLLPGIVRKKYTLSAIGFFLHIPFPSYEVYRTLPWRKEILNGILGADLVGFHTFDYARHFLSAVNRLLDIDYISNQLVYRQRAVKVDSFPLGIDYETYACGGKSVKALKILAKYKRSLNNYKVILSVDRLDYSKGIINRLKAYQLFLKIFPEYREKVTLFLIVVPSRSKVPQYQQIKVEIDKTVGEINGKYNTIGWTPIHYYYRSFNFEHLSAFYQLADVALITPLRDGMNLVAKEYVASRNEKAGVLILSEMAGAAAELDEAVIINPNNIMDIAEGIKTALNMPEKDQRERLISMQKKIKRYTNQYWAKDFFDRLIDVKNLQSSMEAKIVDQQTLNMLLQKYRSAERRLVILDYDGTLVHFSKDPQKASPDRTLLRLIQTLAQNNHLIIVSGRDKETLEKWLGKLDNVNLIAEHGAWSRDAHSDWHLIEPMSDEWKREIRPVMDFYVSRTPGSFIEEKDYSLVWHYRKTTSELGKIRTRELIETLRYLVVGLKLQILEGNKVIEVKNVGINKGRAVSKWIQRITPDFILAFGDDKTDEDIFNEVTDQFTIKVGIGTTAANYRAKAPEDVRQIIEKLIGEIT